MDKVTPTDEQCGIIAAVAEPGGGSIMIEAYAGTGKSKTLQMAAGGVRKAALATAFNKSTAETLHSLLPGQFATKTFNGLGYSAWRGKNQGISTWKLDSRKLGTLVTEVSKERKVHLTNDQWKEVRDTVVSAMQMGISPGDVGEPFIPDTEESWGKAMDNAGVLIGDQEILGDIPKEVLERSNQLARKGVISFDDQVYCPTVLGGAWLRYPVVMVDESQDLSPLNHRQLRNSLAAGGRLIVVGDSRQAIYAFRGADSASMKNLEQLSQGWNRKKLTVTFRCPKVVVEKCQVHAPGFQAHWGNPEGRYIKFKSLGTSWNWKNVMSLLPKEDSSLAVLCRNNVPLLHCAFKLLRRGIGVNFLGRDLGKGIDGLSRKLAKDDETPAKILLKCTREWIEHESSLAVANKKEELLSRIEDQGESLIAVIIGSKATTAGEVRGAIERVFAPSAARITLSSIHKAKGLEWDVVLHLDPWRIPSKRAKLSAEGGDLVPLEQEMNLQYVCDTRTRNVLVEGDLENWREF